MNMKKMKVKSVLKSALGKLSQGEGMHGEGETLLCQNLLNGENCITLTVLNTVL